MVSEVRKSINSILFERVTSPFYGAFLLAWAVWNWRIIYITVFVSEDKIIPNKLIFINENYINAVDMLGIPLLASLILLTIGQVVSNASYWLSLHMRQWKVNKKNVIEKRQLLTLEQSVQLRIETHLLQEKFEKVISEKNTEINLLKNQTEELRRTIESNVAPVHNPYASSSAGDTDYEDFKKTGEAYANFFEVVGTLKETKKFPKRLDEEVEAFYLINNIVEEIPNSNRLYRLSFKGGYFHKKMFNERFSRKENADRVVSAGSS